MKKKLAKYKEEDIIFTKHSLVQMDHRQISRKDVINDIINPAKLVFVRVRDAKEKHYDCFFEKSKRRGHVYGIIINDKCLVVTAIKIGRKWQKRVDRYAKKVQYKL